LYSGTAAVFVFFVLSGYTLSLAARNLDFKKLIAICCKRYPRLMLPSLASCVLAYFILHYLPVSKLHLSEWSDEYGRFAISLTDAIWNGAVQVFLYGESPYNTVLWTMQIELIGSFFIFLLCYLRNIAHKPTYQVLSLMLGFVIVALSNKFRLGLLAFFIGHLYFLYGKKINKQFALVLLS